MADPMPARRTAHRSLHRKAGIVAVTFLLLFTTTGLLLQHAPSLGLGQSHIPPKFAEHFYGVSVGDGDIVAYRTANHRVAHAARFVYVDGAPVESLELNELQGAVEHEQGLWVAGDNQLHLLSARGEALDAWSALDGLPGLITAIGVDASGAPVIIGLRGRQWRLQGDDWSPFAGRATRTRPEQSPQAHRKAILAHANRRLITWERLLTDLHSGRLFGDIGVWVADIAAVLLVLLAGTGILLWFRR